MATVTNFAVRRALVLAWLRKRPAWLFAGLMAVTALLCFCRLGSHGLRMWDETRHGEDAWQMLLRHDYLNYYYDGQPDDWLAKPPLGVWLIALSYQLFGFNEWALRIPSALAGMGCVAWTYALVRLYRGPFTAVLSGLILITCRGIIGTHVSRTGDLDALYICNALGMIYFLARYSQRGERRALLAASLLAGLCFFTKGFMLMLVVPGAGLFLLARGKVWPMLKDVYFWAGLAVLGLFIGGWWFTVKHYSQPFPNSPYGRDSWDTMVEYDIWRRFTEKIEGDTTTPFFVFDALDTRFGPWLYLLYTALASGAVLMRRQWRQWARWLLADELMLLCVCLSGTVCALLATSATKFNWYIAVATPFMAVLTLQLWRRLYRSQRQLWTAKALALAAGGVAISAVGMQGYFMLRHDQGLTAQLHEQLPLLAGADHIYADHTTLYNAVLALKWRNLKIEPAPADISTRPVTEISRSLRTVPGDLRQDQPGGHGYSVLIKVGPGEK